MFSFPIIVFNMMEFLVILSIMKLSESFIKLLGVMIDENIIWNKHIELIENKILKNTGIHVI